MVTNSRDHNVLFFFYIYVTLSREDYDTENVTSIKSRNCGPERRSHINSLFYWYKIKHGKSIFQVYLISERLYRLLLWLLYNNVNLPGPRFIYGLLSVFLNVFEGIVLWPRSLLKRRTGSQGAGVEGIVYKEFWRRCDRFKNKSRVDIISSRTN